MSQNLGHLIKITQKGITCSEFLTVTETNGLFFNPMLRIITFIQDLSTTEHYTSEKEQGIFNFGDQKKRGFICFLGGTTLLPLSNLSINLMLYTFKNKINLPLPRASPVAERFYAQNQQTEGAGHNSRSPLLTQLFGNFPWFSSEYHVDTGQDPLERSPRRAFDLKSHVRRMYFMVCRRLKPTINQPLPRT